MPNEVDSTSHPPPIPGARLCGNALNHERCMMVGDMKMTAIVVVTRHTPQQPAVTRTCKSDHAHPLHHHRSAAWSAALRRRLGRWCRLLLLLLPCCAACCCVHGPALESNTKATHAMQKKHTAVMRMLPYQSLSTASCLTSVVQVLLSNCTDMHC